MIESRTGISYYWSVNNSYELINKISHIKATRSIKTFDFSTLYTNLPLDVICRSLRSLEIIANSKSVSILVNSHRMGQFDIDENETNCVNYTYCLVDIPRVSHSCIDQGSQLQTSGVDTLDRVYQKGTPNPAAQLF